MRWQKRNEEQFLMALFTLGEQKLKVTEGEPVTLLAEVFRVVQGQETGVKVQTMKGSFPAGTLGQVTLWSTEAKAAKAVDREEQEVEGIPHLVLELRPTS